MTRLAHYALIEKIGSGGMGTVYRARDEKLHRDVALKLLLPETAADPDRRARFLREARAVAGLQHPNIVTLHSVEEDGPNLFLTMELIEGATLDQVIPTGGFRLSRLLEIAIPLVDAVAYAHEKGITHRDLKPANIMLDPRGRVRVLDFGLAKLLEIPTGADGATLVVDQEKTAEGKVLGTAAYMSPEQAQGLPLDHRSDLFSLGVLLYEMATGRRPFQGDTHISTISAVLKDEPRPLTELNAEMPRHLSRIVTKCLAKDPARRYQTSADLRIDLVGLKEESESGISEVAPRPEAASSPARGAQPSAGPGGLYAASEDRAAPSRISPPSPEAASPTTRSGVHVPSSPRRRPVWLWPIAAVVVLVGAFAVWQAARRSDDVAGTARDADRSAARPAAAGAADGRTLLVVLPFENLGGAEDAFFAEGVTDEITSRLAAVPGLGVISRKSAARYAGTRKTVPEIGRELGVSWVIDGSVRWQKDARGFGRVRVTPQLVRVADDTQVWSGRYDEAVEEVFAVQERIAAAVVEQLGSSLRLQGAPPAERERPTGNFEAYQLYLQASHEMEGYTAGFEAVGEKLQRAVELDPGFAEAWGLIARLRANRAHVLMDVDEANLGAAREAAERALALAPGSAVGHVAMGYYYYHGRKQYDRALEEFEKTGETATSAEVMDPMAYVLRRMGRLEEARELQERARVLDPVSSAGWAELGYTYGMMGRVEDARRCWNRAIELAPEELPAYFLRGITIAQLTGDPADLRNSLEAMPDDPTGSMAFAWSYLHVIEHDWDRSLAILEDPPVPLAEDDDFYLPVTLARFVTLVHMKSDKAAAVGEIALGELRKAVEASPKDWRRRIALARCLAFRGESDAAVREARTATDLIPVSADAINGRTAMKHRAVVEIVAGRVDEGVAILRDLVDDPVIRTSARGLRTDPFLQGHLDDPRVRALIEAGS